jgi:hypothetical protein
MKNIDVVYLVTVAICLVIGHYSGRVAMKGSLQKALDINESLITLMDEKDSIHTKRELLWDNCLEKMKEIRRGILTQIDTTTFIQKVHVTPNIILSQTPGPLMERFKTVINKSFDK